MSSLKINLDAVDPSGAVAESAAEALQGLKSGDTRLGFFKKAGIAGGAMASSSAVLAALAPSALAASGRPPASFGKGDIGILNYALTLEYLESAFYDETAHYGSVHDPATKLFLAAVKKDEAAHVALLKKALGSKAAARPKFDFGGTTRNQTRFQATSFVLENTGVNAYGGQALNITDPATRTAALSIWAVEARHAGAIGLLLKGTSGVAPDDDGGAFQTTATAAHVLADVKATGFIS
jgi:rubrerythrin